MRHGVNPRAFFYGQRCTISVMFFFHYNKLYLYYFNSELKITEQINFQRGRTMFFDLPFHIPLLLLLLLYLLFFIYYFQKVVSNNREQRKKSFSLMITAFKQNPQLDDEDIFLIYNDFAQKTSRNISYERYLESFIIYVRSNEKDNSFVNSIVEHIKPILNKEKAEQPFSNVDERERLLLLSIDQSVKNNEAASVPNNLRNLSLTIQKTQNELKQAKRINRWSIPISVIGVVLTIISMVMGYFSSSSDIDKISSGVAKHLAEQKVIIMDNNVDKQ